MARAEDAERRQLARRGGGEIVVGFQGRLGLLQRLGWPQHGTPGNLGSGLVQPEDELRHDAEVAASAADGPEQVLVLVTADAADFAVGSDDLDLL